MLKKIITLLVASSALTHGIYAGTPRSELWTSAAIAQAENRPQDLISVLERIAPLAADAQSWSEYALAEEMISAAKAVIAGKDAELARVRALLEALSSAPSPEAKIFLESKLAHAFLDLAHSPRGGTLRGNDDAEPGANLPEDIAEWSNSQLLAAAVAHYENVLSQSDLLKKIPVTAIRAQLKLSDPKIPGKILRFGQTQFPELGLKSDEIGIFSLFNSPEAEYPTLYDFIATDAVKFFTRSAPRKEYRKITEVVPIFADTEEFSDYDPSGVPADKNLIRALQILQDLTRFHASDADKTALGRVTLTRYAWGFSPQSSNGDKENALDEAYETALKKFIADYSYFPISAEASAKLARFYISQKREPEAFDIADRSAEKYGETPYASDCISVLNTLREKELNFSHRLTDCYPKSTPTKISFSAKNISQIRLRAVPANWRDYLKKEHNKPTRLSPKEIAELLASETFTEHTFPLEQFHDFRAHEYRVELPAGTLAPGFYFFFFAPEDHAFSPKNYDSYEDVFPVWISDLAVITEKSRYGYSNSSLVNADGTLPVRVVHAVTGEPVSGAVVSAWNKARWGGERISVPSVKTDALGEAVITGLKKDRDPVVLIECDLPEGDSAGTHQKHAVSIASLYHQNKVKPQPEPNRYCISLFADRPLFRPAQKISFKGVLTYNGKSGTEKSSVAPGKKAEISLINENTNQVIARTEAWSNGFGTFSGTIDIPRELSLGRYLLKAESDGFNTEQILLYIEEYRRPKSELSVEMTNLPQALGHRASATISGKSFTGAPLDGAQVQWKVTSRRSYPPEVIAEGKGVLGADGTLKIAWATQREHLHKYEKEGLSHDEILDRENRKSEYFVVSAEIVDSNGETISRENTLEIANTSAGFKVESSGNPDLNPFFQTGMDVPVFCSVFGNGTQVRSAKLDVFRLIEPESAELAQDDEPNRSQPSIKNLKSGEKIYSADIVAERNNAASENAAHVIPAEKLSSGRYCIRISGVDDFGQKISAVCGLTILDPSATEFVLKKKILLEKLFDDKTLKPGNTAEFLWGSGVKNTRAFVEILDADSQKRIAAFYTDKDRSQQKISVPVTEEMPGKKFLVRVLQISGGEVFVRTRQFSVPSPRPEDAPAGSTLKIEPVSFEKTLTPGNAEVWTFKVLRDNDSPAIDTEVLAALYDCSASAKWHLTPWKLSDVPFPSEFSDSAFSGYTFGNWRYFRFSPDIESPQKKHPHPPYTAPDWIFEPNSYGRFYKAVPVTMSVNRLSLLGGIRAGGESGDARVPHFSSGDTAAHDAAIPESAPVAGAPQSASQKYAFISTDSEEIYAASARKNLQETAFFYPLLKTDANGIITLRFISPEALTRWRLRIFAHDKDLRSGSFTDADIFTTKDLMVQPDAPRFLREGDEIKFPVKITNRGNTEMTGTQRLETEFLSADGKKIEIPQTETQTIDFSLPAQSSKTFFYEIRVPLGAVVMNFRASGNSGKISDGESGALPVLPREVIVTESRTMLVRPGAEAKLVFEKLSDKGRDDAPRSREFRLEAPVSSYDGALLALPYIAEQVQEYESSDSIFYRLYVNALAQEICNSAPQLREQFEKWRMTQPEKFDSPLHSSGTDSPYAGIAAQNESNQRRSVGAFFEPNKLNVEISRALSTLQDRLNKTDGQGWSWFPDSRCGANPHITREILTGIGRLRERIADTNLISELEDLVRTPLAAQSSWLQKHFEERKDDTSLNIDGATLAQYLYMQTLFADKDTFPQPETEAWEYYLSHAGKPNFWANLPRMAQAQTALALWRSGKKEIASKIVESLRQRALRKKQTGMYWNDLPTLPLWLPQYSPIETQAVMIEAFSEIARNEDAVEEMKIWLLTRKQTHAWNSSRASVNAIFALLRGNGIRTSEQKTETVPAKIFAPVAIKFTDSEKQPIQPGELTASPALAEISAKNEGEVPGFISAHWTFSQPLSAITADTPPAGFSVKKTVFKRERTRNGKYKLSPARLEILKPGDEIVVRLTVRADRDFEFVCLKDFRAAGCEPSESLSGWKNNNMLWYYGEPRDTETRFFFDRLPTGTHVFEYTQRVRTSGLYSSGFAEIRSLYAPEFSAHSASESLVSM